MPRTFVPCYLSVTLRRAIKAASTNPSTAICQGEDHAQTPCPLHTRDDGHAGLRQEPVGIHEYPWHRHVRYVRPRRADAVDRRPGQAHRRPEGGRVLAE